MNLLDIDLAFIGLNSEENKLYRELVKAQSFNNDGIPNEAAKTNARRISVIQKKRLRIIKKHNKLIEHREQVVLLMNKFK